MTLFNRVIFFLIFSFLAYSGPASAHEVYFCGEAIPTSREFVANRLMNVIRKQIPNVTLNHLRYQAQRYFPAISYYLKHFGLPDDLKYIPIVECGFRNVSSPAGARGFWQIMPQVAESLKLVVSPERDDRDDPQLATIAACKLIREHFFTLKNRLNVSSWVLTAAAYNFGPTNIIKTVQKQGKDYFNMTLNAETAEYVYRLIAVKELFEHPELYMKGFGTNIFSTPPPKNKMDKNGDIMLDELARSAPPSAAKEEDEIDFKTVKLEVSKTGASLQPETRSSYIAARLVSDIRRLKDGQSLKFELLETLKTSDFSRAKGGIVQGQAWIIDGRILVDFGLGDELELNNKDRIRGLDLQEVRAHDGTYVLLKRQVAVEN